MTAATTANVTASASSVTLFAAQTARVNVDNRIVSNDSTAVLYLKYGTTASATSYTVKILANGYFEFPPPVYAGRVDGIWSSATGAARTTEVS